MKKWNLSVVLIGALSIALAISLVMNFSGETKAQMFSKNFSSQLKECVGDTLGIRIDSQDLSMQQMYNTKAVLQEVGSDFVRFDVLIDGQPLAKVVVPMNSISRIMTGSIKGKLVLFNLKFTSGEFIA